MEGRCELTDPLVRDGGADPEVEGGEERAAACEDSDPVIGDLAVALEL